MAGLRVSPPRIFPAASRASRPPAEAAGAADAYRQASFVLGDEIDVILRGLNLEGAIAEASRGAKFRNQVVASSLAFWSRSWLARLQALHAVEWGNYMAAFPLVRSAVDYQAAGAAMVQSDAAEWVEWLEDGGIAPAHAEHATEFRLHSYRAAEVIAADEVLASIYRVSSDFAMPHFGATLALVASESTPDRVLVTFGDRDFHVALAELVIGWLAALSSAQLGAATESGVFGVDEPERVERVRDEIHKLLGRRDRCRIEEIERDAERRYLVHNWRRSPGSAAKRLLL